MTKAYFVNHANAIIHEDGSLTALRPVQTNIDWIYIAPEDMEITYSVTGNDQETKQVKAGDIIIQMYENDSDPVGYKRVIVISSEEWKTNLELYGNPKIASNEDLPVSNTCCDCQSPA